MDFKKTIPIIDLLNSTSIALGEAYMNGDLTIEGNLYDALIHFLGQMDKFSLNETLHDQIINKSNSQECQEH